jgi:predicted site-specific integrase-resolvase
VPTLGRSSAPANGAVPCDKTDNSPMAVDEVTKLWGCPRITVLRLIKCGHLHPLEIEDGELRFDRTEVLRLANRRIAFYPHLTIASRRK